MFKNKFVAALLIALVLVLGFFYVKSSKLVKSGDKLVQNDKFEEALLFFEQAQKVFPLSVAIPGKIRSTKLLLASEMEYGRIDQVYAEVQEVPQEIVPTNPETLKSGELLVPILMYHHIRINPKPGDPTWAILNVSPNQLDEEFKYLSDNGFHVISLDDLLDALNGSKKLPDKPVVLTFDDGYENFYTSAFPLLKKYNFKATIFIITQGVSNNAAYLTWPQVSEMDRSGLVTIGAHTQHHPNLPDLSQALIKSEVEGSRDDIQSHIGKAPKWFAYPYGSYSNFIIDTVRQAGFEGAVSTIYGLVQNKDNLYLLRRVSADGRFTVAEFAKHLQ